MPEHVCPPWLSFLLTNVFRRMAHNPGKILGAFIREGDTVLDVGCGPGFFTIPLAALVGETGTVVAADLNAGMLDKVARRAERAGIRPRIRLHVSRLDRLDVVERVDFVLAFWMAHEVRDPGPFFREISGIMKACASFLLVEPKLHVPEDRWQDLLDLARKAGLQTAGTEAIRISRAVVLRTA